MEKSEGLKQILFLTDGSPCSLNAEELTVFLAKKFGSRVTVFHVVTHELMRPAVQGFLVRGRALPEASDIKSSMVASSGILLDRQTPTSPGAHYSERIEDEVTRACHQEAEGIVARAAQVFKEKGVRVDQKVVENKSIAQAVMDESEREDYELIVMGRSSHEEKGSRLGAVAERVSRQSSLPAMVVGQKSTMSKILIPMDGSRSSEKALQFGALLARKLGSEITVLHVQESRLFGVKPELTRAIGKGILADAAQSVKGVPVEKRLESGHPARKITEVAGKENFDLIVVGSRGHSGLGRIHMGSVSSHVLHYADSSVLVVR